jgi:hypothetical protein
VTEELPDEEIQAVEGINVAHDHDGVSSADGSLVAHLQAVHGLDTDPGLSATTQEGLHDRLHHETDAADS